MTDWHATQQYGWSQEDDEGGDDDDEVVRRPGWSDAQMAESPRGLAARWAACGLENEMDDELTGEPSEAGVDDEHVGQHLRRVASRWNPSVIS